MEKRDGDGDGKRRMEKLLARLKNNIPDDKEWIELHNWVNGYVRENKISKRFFVDDILHFPNYYVTYFYPGGLRNPPSREKETQGELFRNAIKLFQENPSTATYPRDLKAIILEYPKSTSNKKIENIFEINIDENYITLSISVIQNYLEFSEENEKQQIKDDLEQYLLDYVKETVVIEIENWIVVYL